MKNITLVLTVILLTAQFIFLPASGIAQHKPHRHFNRHPHIVTPAFGKTLPHRPPQAMYMRNGRHRNFYHRGVHYRPYQRGYQIVRPVPGIRIRVLPVGYRAIRHNNRSYYYAQGVYYQSCSKGFRVVRAPIL